MLSEKQLEERLDYIGSSDAAGALGLSKYKTPLSVWAEKTRQIPVVDISDKLQVKLGHKLEPIVAELFVEKTGKKLRRVNETIYHKKYKFLAANIDRRIEKENTIVEIKTTSAYRKSDWADNNIPMDYLIQVYHQLMVTGMPFAWICVLIGNEDLQIKEIARDEKVIGDLVKKEVAFWENYVIPKKMPGQIMAQDGDTLYQLFPQAEEGEARKLDDQANMICESLDSLKVDLKSVKGTIEKQQNELKALLGESEAGTTDHYRISWKNQSQNRLDTKKLKEDEPKIYAKYLKETKFRKLTISQIKEGEK